MSKIKNSFVALGILFTLFLCARDSSYGQTAKPPSDVNVVNTPNVRVGNTAGDPVPARDVDNPAKQPFTNTVVLSNNNSFQVPVGKRLVIEFVSGQGFIPQGQTFLDVAVKFFASIDGNSASVAHHFMPVRLGSKDGFDRFVIAQQTRIYSEDGTVTLLVERTSGAGDLFLTISGYLVDK